MFAGLDVAFLFCFNKNSYFLFTPPDYQSNTCSLKKIWENLESYKKSKKKSPVILSPRKNDC